MKSFILFLLYCPSLYEICYSYKILVFSPRFGRSDVTFAGNIADAMSEAGHNVVVLLYEINPYVKTNGTKLAKTILLPVHPSAAKFFQKSAFNKDYWTINLFGPLSQYNVMNRLGSMFTKTCRYVNSHSQVIEALKSVKFDLAVAEVFDTCAFGLIELMEIPAHVATCSSLLLDGAARAVGVPKLASYVPSTFSYSSNEMSYTERISNLFSARLAQMFHDSVVIREQRLFRNLYGENFIDINEKIAQSSFLITNSDPLYDFPSPTLHKVIPVGGLNVEVPKPLNERWSEVMNQRSKAVLVSFGSVVKSFMMPEEMKSSILKAFSKFPEVTFIWKYEKAENIAKDYDNVVIADWVPQNDLLNDERIAAFITNGGMNSIHEAVHSGTPMIVVPIFGDQMRNAKMVERAGVGIVFEKDNLKQENHLIVAVSRILNNESYIEASDRLAAMIRKKPINVRQNLVRHLEFAAEFGRLPNMDNLGRKLPFYQYYMLDIFIPLSLICFSFGLAIMFLLKSIVIMAIWGPKKETSSISKAKAH